MYNGDSWHKKKSGENFWRYSCGINVLRSGNEVGVQVNQYSNGAKF